MTSYEIISIVAIFAGPIVAIQIQKIMESVREDKVNKIDLFQILMMTRADRMSTEHIDALNRIDIEFSTDTNLLGIRKKQTSMKIFLILGKNILIT